MEIFNRKNFEIVCTKVCTQFEKSAPTVSELADKLYQAKDKNITLAEIHLLSKISEMQPNYAANALYHLMEDLGQDTTGHAGF